METSKQRTERLMAMTHAQLMMHCQDLTAERDKLKDLLYSWANNWDSEFMNDPDWKNKDVLIIQEALRESA